MAAENLLARQAQAVDERPGLAPMLVDEPEARRLLGGLRSKTLYNLRRSGDLVGVKVGSRILYDTNDLRAFIDSKKGAGRE